MEHLGEKKHKKRCFTLTGQPNLLILKYHSVHYTQRFSVNQVGVAFTDEVLDSE